MNTPKRAVICARVSTDTQAEQGRSIHSQIMAMLTYIERQGMVLASDHANQWTIAQAMRRFNVNSAQAENVLQAINGKAVYVDDISGTVPVRQRPGGKQLYTYIDNRLAEAVIFYTVDRVTRDDDLIEINVIRRDIRDAGMELHYANDGGKADLSTMGGMIDTLKAAVAAEERKKIVERNMRGRMAKAQSGRWVGEGKPPYGYRKVGKLKEAYLEVDETQAAVVRRIFAKYLGGPLEEPMSIAKICEMLIVEGVPPPIRGNWCKRTIGIILRQTAYVGRFQYRGIEIPIPNLRIISDDEFYAGQTRAERNKAMAKRNRIHDYLLTSRIRCSCGRMMSGRKKLGKYQYYVCSSMFLPKPMRTCHERHIRADIIDAQVWDWLMGLLGDERLLSEGLERMAQREQAQAAPRQDRLREVETEIDRAERKLQRLVSKFGDAEENVLKALEEEAKQTGRSLAAMRVERDRLQEEIRVGQGTVDQRAQLLARIPEIRAGLVDADFETRRYTLEQMALKVEIQKNNGDYQAEVSCDIAVWSIVTTHPQTAPPATPVRCCDSRLAPKIPDDPAG